MINSLDTTTGTTNNINNLQQQQNKQQQSQNQTSQNIRQNRQSTPERIEAFRDNENHLDKKLKTFFHPQSSQSPQQQQQQFQPQKQNLMSTMKKPQNDQKWVAYSDQKNTRGIYYRMNVKDIENSLKQKRLQSNSPNKSSLHFGQLYEQSLKQSIEVYANDNQYLSHEQRSYLQKLLKQEEIREQQINSNSNLNNIDSNNNQNSNNNLNNINGEKLKPLLHSSGQKQQRIDNSNLNMSISQTTTLPTNSNLQPQTNNNNYMSQNSNANQQNSPKSNSPVGGVKTEGDVFRQEKEGVIRQENYRQLWNRLLPYLEKPKFLKSSRQHSQPNQQSMVYPQQLNQMNTQPDESGRGYNSNHHNIYNQDASLNTSEYYHTLNNLDKMNSRPLPLIHQTKQQQQLLQQQQQQQLQNMKQSIGPSTQVKDKLRDSYYQLDMFANGVRQERSFHQVRHLNAGTNNRTSSVTPEKPNGLKNNSQYYNPNYNASPQTNPFLSQNHSNNNNNNNSYQRESLKSPNNRYYSNSMNRNQGNLIMQNNSTNNDLVKQYKECTELLSLVQVNLSNIVSNMNNNKKTPKGDFSQRRIQPIGRADQFSKTIFYDGKMRKKGMEKMVLPSLYITRNSPSMEQQNSPVMQQKSRSSSVLRQDDHIINNHNNMNNNNNRMNTHEDYNSKTFSHQVPGLLNQQQQQQQQQQPQTIDDLEYQQDFDEDDSNIIKNSNLFQQPQQQQPTKSLSSSNMQIRHNNNNNNHNLTPVQEQNLSKTEDIPQSLKQSQQMQIIEKEPTTLIYQSNESYPKMNSHVNNLVSSGLQTPNHQSIEAIQNKAFNQNNHSNNQSHHQSQITSQQISPSKNNAEIEIQQQSEYQDTPKHHTPNHNSQNLSTHHHQSLSQQQQQQQSSQFEEEQYQQSQQPQQQIEQQEGVAKQEEQQQEDQQYEQQQQQQNQNEEQQLQQEGQEQQYYEEQQQQQFEESQELQNKSYEQQKSKNNNSKSPQQKIKSTKSLKSGVSSLQMSKNQSPQGKQLENNSQRFSKKSLLKKSIVNSSRQSQPKIKDISQNSRNSSKSPTQIQQRQSQKDIYQKSQLNSQQNLDSQEVINEESIRNKTPTRPNSTSPQQKQNQSPYQNEDNIHNEAQNHHPQQSPDKSADKNQYTNDQTPENPENQQTINESPKKEQQQQQEQQESPKKEQNSPNKQQQQQLEQEKQKQLEEEKKEQQRILSEKAAQAAAQVEAERKRKEEEMRIQQEKEEQERNKPLIEQIKNLDKLSLKEDIQDIQIDLNVNRYTGNLLAKLTYGNVNEINEQTLSLKFLKKFEQKNKEFRIERQMNVFKLPISLLANRQFITEKNQYNTNFFFECTDSCIQTKALEIYKPSYFKPYLLTSFLNDKASQNQSSRECPCININNINIFHDEEFYQCDTLLIEYEKFETLDEIIQERITKKQPFSEYELLIAYLQMLYNYQFLVNNNIIHQNINSTQIAFSYQDSKFKFMPLTKAHAYNFGDFSPRETKTDKFMIKGEKTSHPVWLDLVNLGIVFCQMKLLDKGQTRSVLDNVSSNDKTISKQIITMLISNNKCEDTLNECIELIYQNISSASFLNLILQPINHEIKSDFELCKRMKIIAKTYEQIHQLKDACLLYSDLAIKKETVYGKNTDEYYQGLCDELFIYYKDGQVDKLEGLYEKCQEYFKVIPSLPQSVEYLHYIAEIQWRLGKEKESEEFFEKAFKIISTSSDKIDSRYMTNIFNNKGVNELSRDQYEKSVQFFEEALKYCNEQRELNKMMESSILNNYSISLLKLNRLEESLEKMLKSLEVKKEIGVLESDVEGSKMAYAISMLYKQTQNDLNKSIEYLDYALLLQQYHNNYLEQIKYLYKKTQLYFEANMQAEAIESALQALPFIDKCELATFRQIIQITYDLACIFKNKNLKQEAIVYFTKAYDVGVRIAGPQVLAVQQIKKELDKLQA